MASQRIGFIGVGKTGGAMAMRLADAGIPLIIFDPDPANITAFPKGHAVASPREMADEAEIIFAWLPSPEASREVALGENEVGGGGAVKLYIEMSTIGAPMMESIAGELHSLGIGFLDAPVSAPGGGSAGAREGMLTSMVSGDRDSFDRGRPLLEIIARNVFYLGDKPGQAQIAKMINNYVAKAAEVASFEGVALGIKAGLDAEALIDVINVSSGRNGTTMDKFPSKILPRKFPRKGSLRNTFKDAERFLEEARRLDIPLWIAPHVLTLFREASAEGYAESDHTRVFEFVEKRAGIIKP